MNSTTKHNLKKKWATFFYPRSLMERLIYGKCTIYHEDIGETCAIVGDPPFSLSPKLASSVKC
jgi:hypothetical protein